LAPHERRLSNLLPIVRAQDAMLANHLQRWCAGGEYGELFDMPVDGLRTDTLCLWDISAHAGDIATRNPLASYLLHRLTMAFDGAPTLLVLDEGFDLLANPLFGARAPAWLDYATQRNVGVVLNTEHLAQSGNYAFTAGVAAKAASIFAMPDAEPVAEYAYGFGFSQEDMAALAYMKNELRHVLLKRGKQSTLMKMDLSNLGQHLTTLSGRAVLVPQKSAADLLSELMGYGASAPGVPA